MPRVAIIGGGISGLALAYRLEQLEPALDVEVLEQQEHLGGTIGTYRAEGYQVEQGPNGFLDSKPATLRLCRDLGLSDQLVPAGKTAQRNRYLLLEGRLHLLPSSLSAFLMSGVLSWRGKLALLGERFFRRSHSNRDESIADFARRRVGAEVTNTLVDAFVTGIHGGDPELLSIQAAFPRLAELEREHGSILRGLARQRRQRIAAARAAGQPVPSPPQMWSLLQGMGQLIETLGKKLRQPPRCRTAVRSLARLADGSGWLLEGQGELPCRADVVVLTCPAEAQGRILSPLDPALAERIATIPYNRIVVAALGYRSEEVPHRLDGFGYLSPQRERRDVLGAQWCSSIFAHRAPAGHVVLRCLCGGWHRGEMVDWDDERLLTAVRGELAEVLKIEAPPRFVHFTRWPRAIPQYHRGHLDRVAWIEKRLQELPGIYLGGNAYRGVAVNDCVEQAQVLADRIHRDLRARRALSEP